MKKGFTVILLSVFLLYRITFPTSVVHAEEVEISAPSGILMEMSTGTVLFEKDADTARPPASVTKIMTMLLIFDALENGTIYSCCRPQIQERRRADSGLHSVCCIWTFR